METLEQVAKTAQDIFMGSRFVDPGAKTHMMAYDMQLKDFTTMYEQGSNTVKGGHED